MSAFARLLDLAWPRDCEIATCRHRVDRPGRHVCSDCLMRLPFVRFDGVCQVCGRAVPGFEGEFLCAECRARRPRFDRVASALRFEGEARQMILDFKFNRHLWLRDDFVDWIEAAVRARFDPAAIDAVVPLPLTRFHRFDRGFNQTVYLSAPLARRLDRRLLGKALRRTGASRRQSGLDEKERVENVKGTFVCVQAPFVRGRTLLLVDDILTTGSTLSECARVLKEAGAVRVWGVTLARTERC